MSSRAAPTKANLTEKEQAAAKKKALLEKEGESTKKRDVKA